MSNPENSSKIGPARDVVGNLIGKRVVKVVAGGSAGSIIGLYFGEANTGTAEVIEDGWYLGVECSWRLEKAGIALTASRDDNIEGGPMLSNLNGLLGNSVIGVDLKEPLLDLAIDFDMEEKLSIFCDVLGNGTCWYTLSPYKESMSIEPAGTIVFAEDP